jgi:hypothetical protein
MTNYMHCVLKHGDGSTQVSWIPSEFAEEGRYLKLKDRDGWKDGWQVVTAYPSILSEVLEIDDERKEVN